MRVLGALATLEPSSSVTSRAGHTRQCGRMARVQVDVLGPLRVRADDQEIDLGGPRNRALVARLALEGGRPVASTTLIDDLWGLDVPADATNALQSIVSRTRRRLPAGALESTPAGYVLQCASVDADEFERLVASGRADEALALWRGEALADVAEFPFAPSAAHRLGEVRLAAVESSLHSRVRSGDDPAVIAELADLTTAHPYRDGFWALYLSALAAHGRANEAITAYDGLRGMLAEELGADPSAELQELHLSILRGERGPRRTHQALPSALTTFVGREGAIADLQAALVDHRLVTILGPGGAGKTRLAVETARSALDRFEDVWLTELAPVTGSDGILEAILSAMGLLEVSVLDRPSSVPRPDERTRLIDAVHDVEGLLLLDNCEHLVDAVAEIADDVLAHAAKLRILATSREPLRIIGEFGYQLSPLTMPAADSSIDDAMKHSAIQLFVLRAQAVDQSFALTAETLPAVREICVRLDGQPLAIELAAARLRTLTAAQVAARLSDRFRLLTGGSRTALPRHRTLRAVVEWSWDLLDDAERDLAERLAVFPGGVTAESAAAVSVAGEHTESLLESLADKSLLVPVRGDTPRFRMLETLREYGVERLIERGEAEAVRDAHLKHFLDVAETQGPQLRGGDQLSAVRNIDLERANIMAALRFAIDRGDRPHAARLVTELAWYWSIRSQHVEACSWADAVLALPGEADPASEICVQAVALTGILVMGNRDSDQPALWQEPVDRILGGVGRPPPAASGRRHRPGDHGVLRRHRRPRPATVRRSVDRLDDQSHAARPARQRGSRGRDGRAAGADDRRPARARRPLGPGDGAVPAGDGAVARRELRGRARHVGRGDPAAQRAGRSRGLGVLADAGHGAAHRGRGRRRRRGAAPGAHRAARRRSAGRRSPRRAHHADGSGARGACLRQRRGCYRASRARPGAPRHRRDVRWRADGGHDPGRARRDPSPRRRSRRSAVRAGGQLRDSPCVRGTCRSSRRWRRRRPSSRTSTATTSVRRWSWERRRAYAVAQIA